MTTSNPNPYDTPAPEPDSSLVPPPASAPTIPPPTAPVSESPSYDVSTDYTAPTLTDRGAGDDASANDDDSSVKDKAADTAAAGKQAAGEVAHTAVDKAQDVAQEAKAQVRNLAGQAQDQLREQAGAQHRNLVTNLRALGDELTSMAENSEKSGPATDLVGEAGARAHSTASWLDDREPGQLIDELRSFARRKPGVFVLGALAAGVLAGRLTRGVVAVHQDDDDSNDSNDSNDDGTARSSSGELAGSHHRAISTPDTGTLGAGAGETGASGAELGAVRP